MPTIRLVKSHQEFEAEPDAIILDAAEDAGIGMVHSCRSGTCRACLTKVLSGVVEHDPEYVLEINIDTYEVEDGYRLLCSAFARTDCELER